MHICVGKLTIIGSDNALSPGRRQAIIWTKAEILLIGPLGTNFSENSIGIQIFSFKKLHLKMSSAKWRLFRLGINELRGTYNITTTKQSTTKRHPYCMGCSLHVACWSEKLFPIQWFGLLPKPLKHWGWYKMAAVSQTTLSSAFSWMKILEFRLRFHWSLFL